MPHSKTVSQPVLDGNIWVLLNIKSHFIPFLTNQWSFDFSSLVYTQSAKGSEKLKRYTMLIYDEYFLVGCGYIKILMPNLTNIKEQWTANLEIIFLFLLTLWWRRSLSYTHIPIIFALQINGPVSICWGPPSWF